MVDSSPVPETNGKITTTTFYKALMDQNDRMAEMERRLTVKLDKLASEGSPALASRVKSLEDEQDVLCQDLENIKRITYSWSGINSALAVIAGALGFGWRQ
jgi:hypothetical protein